MFTAPAIASLPRIQRRSELSLKEIADLHSQGWTNSGNGFLLPPMESKTPWDRRRNELLTALALITRRSPSEMVVTGLCAGLLQGWITWPIPETIDCYTSANRRGYSPISRQSPVLAHRLTAPPPPSHMHPAGIPITDDHSILVNAVRFSDAQSAFVTICSALNKITSSALVNVTSRSPSWDDHEAAVKAQLMESRSQKSSNTRGITHAHALIEAASGRVESVGEARFLYLCQRYGLPRPTIQARIVASGNVFYADFLWKEADLIVEFDGEGKFFLGNDPESKFSAELERQSLLTEEGYRIIRCNWDSLANPGRLIQRIASALRVEPKIVG